MDKLAIIVKIKEKRKIKISFPFDIITVNQVKEKILSRTYDKVNRVWYAPICPHNIRMLKELKFILSTELINIQNKASQKKLPALNITGLKHKLYPFQKDGVAFIELNNGRALIGDEMGLGKTMQALAYFWLHKEEIPIIIVCPASLKYNWLQEIVEWLPITENEIQVLSGKTIVSITKKIIIIINYDILSAWAIPLHKIAPKLLIYDECHFFKNSKSQRTKAVKKLSKGIKHIICLSGTPILNRPNEIYNAVAIINNDIFANYWKFAMRYCGPKHNGFGWAFNGATHTDELNSILTENIMIRRLKKDVLKDLPDKTRTSVPMELNNLQEYMLAEHNFINWIKGDVKAKAEQALINARGDEYSMALQIDEKKVKELQDAKISRINILTQIEVLKQLAVKGKLKSCTDWIDNFLDTDKKLVIFATHKFVIDYLMEKYKSIAVKIDGSVATNKRQDVVKAFQTNKKVRLFVGNIQAAGVGLTLTAASDVVFLELPWSPALLEQAEDRVHRIGQKNAVNIYYLLAKDTIEEKIAKLISSKKAVLDMVLDGKEVEETSLLNQLIKQII